MIVGFGWASQIGGSDGEPRARLAWGTRLAVINLAFVPSGLLVAYTTYLTTDLASAPKQGHEGAPQPLEVERGQERLDAER